MPSRHSEAFIFSVKAAVSAVVAVLVCDLLRLPAPIWGAVSAVLVSQPSVHSSARTALTRVIANLLGAFCGAVFTMSVGYELPALALGVMFTGLACYYLKADEAMRPAFAAVVIVTMNNDPDKWTGSWNRVIEVTVGCLCALAVGGLFALAFGRAKPVANSVPPPPPDHTE